MWVERVAQTRCCCESAAFNVKEFDCRSCAHMNMPHGRTAESRHQGLCATPLPFDGEGFDAICEPFSLKLAGVLQRVAASLREKGVCGDGPQAIGLEQPIFGCFLGFDLAPFTDMQRINSQLDQFRANHHKTVTL